LTSHCGRQGGHALGIRVTNGETEDGGFGGIGDLGVVHQIVGVQRDPELVDCALGDGASPRDLGIGGQPSLGGLSRFVDLVDGEGAVDGQEHRRRGLVRLGLDHRDRDGSCDTSQRRRHGDLPPRAHHPDEGSEIHGYPLSIH
jgi:hypothetical protein